MPRLYRLRVISWEFQILVLCGSPQNLARRWGKNDPSSFPAAGADNFHDDGGAAGSGGGIEWHVRRHSVKAERDCSDM